MACGGDDGIHAEGRSGAQDGTDIVRVGDLIEHQGAGNATRIETAFGCQRAALQTAPLMDRIGAEPPGQCGGGHGLDRYAAQRPVFGVEPIRRLAQCLQFLHEPGLRIGRCQQAVFFALGVGECGRDRVNAVQQQRAVGGRRCLALAGAATARPMRALAVAAIRRFAPVFRVLRHLCPDSTF